MPAVEALPDTQAKAHYHRVAGLIRSDIAAGELLPGQRLKIRLLSDRYGVSAAPVREALQILQGEGFVVMEQNCGAHVRRINEQLLVNIFDLRSAIESFLTARYAETASPHGIAVLEDIQAQHDDAVSAHDFLTAFDLNRMLHAHINQASRNTEALEVIERHQVLTRSLRLNCGFSETRVLTVQKEHHEIIHAIKTRNCDAAQRLSEGHVRSSRDDLLSRLPPAFRGAPHAIN